MKRTTNIKENDKLFDHERVSPSPQWLSCMIELAHGGHVKRGAGMRTGAGEMEMELYGVERETVFTLQWP